MPVRTLVIGASSFFGSYMCEYLQHQGCEVTGTWAHTTPVTSNIKWEQLDLLEPENIRFVLEKSRPQRIFSFGTQNSVGQSWADPGQTVEINVNGAINLFEAIRKTALDPTVVLSGAGEEYGRVGFDRMPIRETENPCPANIYAASMACQTMMARIYNKAYGMRLIVARTFNVIGPGQSKQFAVSDFCYQGAMAERGAGARVIRVGNINIQRDFTDIRDLVRAYWMLSEKGCTGEVYNVGTGKAVCLGVVLEHLKKKLNINVETLIERERIRPLDSPKLEGDISKLKQDTGWEPEITLEQSVSDMLQFWRENLE